MTDSDWRRRAAERLRTPPRKAEAPRSVAAQVTALLDEIITARAAGKTWQEISDDVADDSSVSPDTLRIAFARANHRRGARSVPAKSVDATASARAAAPPSASGESAPGADPTKDVSPARAAAAEVQSTFELGQRWQDE
jgi:predicted metal-dependent hydrolase